MRLGPGRLLIIFVLAALAWFYRGHLSDAWQDAKGAGTRLSTWMELGEYAEGLRSWLRDESVPENFSAWIDRRFDEDFVDGGTRRASVDRYGMPYRLDAPRRGGPIILRSCGPDQRCNNDDDITVEVDVDGR